jgi:hypothetical protein
VVAQAVQIEDVGCERVFVPEPTTIG